MKWIIQNNLIKEGVKELIYACEQLGVEHGEVSVIPFDPTLPDVDTTKSTLFYGGTNWIYNIWKSKLWNPGVFFNEDNFTYSSYLKNWKMLNDDAEIWTFKSFKSANFKPTDEFFIRPNKDLKEFAGEIIVYGEFREWYNNLYLGGFDLDTKIVISSPKNISCEWRLFIVNGVVVSGSRYRSWGRLDQVSGVPEEVRQFAEEQILKWSPHSIFVLDVGIENSITSEFKVIEANCFNSCGFYKSDVTAIVKAIEDEYRDTE